MTQLTHPSPEVISAQVLGTSARFPVHRIYCVGRNYEEHAKEMGYTGREPPFFFLKPADALICVKPEEVAHLPYPSLTHNFHHEIELVVAIGVGGKNIAAKDAHEHIFGYAVGLDMTRRDLQNDMKKQGRPWDIGKAFDDSAPMGPITPKENVKDIEHAAITLSVNQDLRQSSHISKLIWNIAETIEHLSSAWELKPGDLIFSGTPEGVGAVIKGDVMHGHVDGLTPIRVEVV
jgi:fumarylpyruvate hydrolase